MKPQKQILVLFAALFLFAQIYSLAAGVCSASVMVPKTLEDLQDTDLEEIVTVDPFLPSKSLDAASVEVLHVAVPLISIVVYLALLWSFKLDTLSNKAWLSGFPPGATPRYRPRGGLWLTNRALLI